MAKRGRLLALPVRVALTVLALMAWTLTLPVARAGETDQASPVCGARITTIKTRIPMSDGTKLSVTVFVPGQGTYPTILAITPYGKRRTPPSGFGPKPSDCYAFVYVDVRGTGGSDGAICIFCEREQRDIHEVINWVAAQTTWSNANVAMKGNSYSAINALFGAVRAPEALKAIIVDHAASDLYRDAAWHNGMYNTNFISQWTAYQTAMSINLNDPPPQPEQRLNNQVPHEARLQEWENGFYLRRSVYPLFDEIQVPALFWTGWFDGFSRGTIRAFQGIASEHKRLIVDPFGHHYGDVPFELQSRYASAYSANNTLYGEEVLAWLDRFLKDEANEVENKLDVHYFDLGTAEWRDAGSWPPPGARTEEMFLSGAPSGSEDPRGVLAGTLSPTPPEEEAARADSYVYEPAAGASDTFSKFAEVASVQAHLDQRGEETKALTYTTDPADHAVQIAGPMELRFWSTTTAPDTDWVVKVSHVYPNGESELITSGYMRASHRRWDESLSRPAEPWITNQRPGPGKLGDSAPYIETEDLSKPTEYRVDVWPTAVTLEPGHQLRITITSSDVPTHEPLPLPAVNTILHDEDHPSRLIITTVPEQAPTVPSTSLSFTGSTATSGQYSDTAVVQAVLTDDQGAPMEGQQIEIGLSGAGGASEWVMTTGDDGKVTLSVPLEPAPGRYELVAQYMGQPDVYAGSKTAPITFEILRDDSVSTVAVAGKGNDEALNSSLTDHDTPTNGLGGRDVSFYADGSFIGRAVTAPDGTAIFEVPARYRSKKHKFSVVFAGDEYYNRSSATASHAT